MWSCHPRVPGKSIHGVQFGQRRTTVRALFSRRRGLMTEDCSWAGVALGLWGALISGCSLEEPSPSGGLPSLRDPCGPLSLDARAMGGSELGAGSMSERDGGDPAGTGVAPESVVSDDFATDVRVAVHPDVNTLLVVTWSQAVAAEEAWLEFTFENGEIMRSRGSAGSLGEHRDVVLGVPGETDVTVRIVSRSDGINYRSRDYSGRTRAVPTGANGMPVPTIVSYDPALASSSRWLFGFGGGLERWQVCGLLPLDVLALHHGSPGPHRLVLCRSRQQRDVILSADRSRRRVSLAREALLQLRPEERHRRLRRVRRQDDARSGLL